MPPALDMLDGGSRRLAIARGCVNLAAGHFLRSGQRPRLGLVPVACQTVVGVLPQECGSGSRAVGSMGLGDSGGGPGRKCRSFPGKTAGRSLAIACVSHGPREVCKRFQRILKKVASFKKGLERLISNVAYRLDLGI